MKLDDLKKGVGGHVFISHSHKDIEKVRQIRNVMEEQGFEPLCFYLKCLSEDDEIEGLIKRKIDARELFVYVNSKNARESKWVQKERAYIESKGRKIDRIVDLDNGSSMEDAAARLMNSMRVFISYSHKDSETSEKLAKELIKRDLKVFIHQDLRAGSSIQKQIEEEINNASRNGCFVILLSQNSIQSEFVQYELQYADRCNAWILPIYIGDISFPLSIQMCTGKFQSIYLPEKPNQKDIERAADAVEALLIRKFANKQA